MGFIQNGGNESTLPKTSAKRVLLIKVTGVRAKQVTHRPGEGAAFAWGQDEMKMISHEALRARQEIRCTFCCWPPGPLARRERRAYPLRPLRYVRSEQHSQRACGPQPGGARRRRARIGGVAAPRRCHHIACVAAPRICPPGARAKMHTLFSDGP